MMEGCGVETFVVVVVCGRSSYDYEWMDAGTCFIEIRG